MSERGFIALHRDIVDHWIYKDPVKLKAWLTILLEVNYKPGNDMIKGHFLECDRGESIYSLQTWARKFGSDWNRSKVVRFFKLLERDKMIETENETVTLRLKVCNYDSYQDVKPKSETVAKRQRNGSETPANTTKQSNKETKEQGNISMPAEQPPEPPNTPAKRFVPPTLQEVQQYIFEKNYNVNAETFWNYYESNGWMVGKNKMKSWNHAVGTWNSKENSGKNKPQTKPNQRREGRKDALFTYLQEIGDDQGKTGGDSEERHVDVRVLQ